jgi:hypothetical protein
MLLAELALMSVLIDPAHCAQRSAGQSRWETDGRGTLTVSTEAGFTGEVVLRCRVKLPRAAAVVSVAMERLRIAFRPAAAEGGHSGLIVTVAGRAMEITQVSREDWIESSHRSWQVRLPQPSREVQVEVTAVDDSPLVGVRVDVRGLRISAEGEVD